MTNPEAAARKRSGWLVLLVSTVLVGCASVSTPSAPVRPPTASATRTPVATAAAVPSINATTADSPAEAWIWGLDIAASGITLASPRPFSWGAALELHGGRFLEVAGAGGGCDSFQGTYAVTSPGLTFNVPQGPSSCTYLGTEQLRPRLAQVASYDVSTTASCRDWRFSGGTFNPCVRLRLFDRAGAVVLTYVAFGPYYASFPGPPPSPIGS